MEPLPDRSPAVEAEETTRFVYQNWRERFVTPLLLGALIIGLFALIPAVGSAQSPILDAAFIGAYVVIGLVTFIRFPYALRMGVFLFTVYALGAVEIVSTGILGDGIFFLLAFIVLTTMMFSPRAGIIATAITLVTFGIMAWLTLSGRLDFINPAALDANYLDWLSASIITLLLSAAIILGFQRLHLEFLDAQKQRDETLLELKSERTNLEQNVADQTRRLRKVNEISRAISAILEPEELLARAVQLIGAEFDCYFTAIYLLDPSRQWAELKEATGDAGKVLRENKYRLDANGKNMVGTAIRTRQPRIALDKGDDPVQFDNPLLRYTRSQITIPLIVGDRVLGALDLQSTREAAFNVEDIDTYQNMANQVAISLENARLFNEAQRTLAEMQATQRQYLHGAWNSLATEQNLEYGLGDEDPTERAAEIEVPLALRDQIIGQISMSGKDEWTPDQRSMIETIATQAALALENARLVEESQTAATRERLVNEITAKIWSSPTIDGILQTAVKELGRAMDASEVNIEINVEDSNG